MPATMLRPLSLGELLDRTFSLYKENFLLFLGVMVWPSLVAIAVALLNLGIQSFAVRPKGPTVGFFMIGAVGGGFLLLIIVHWIAYAVALGATTFAVADVYLGQSATIAGSYRKMRGHTWRLMKLLGWIGLVLFVVMLVSAIVISIAAALGAMIGGVAIVILLPLMIVWFMWLALRYSVAVPALMVEDLKAAAAADRSERLMKGNFIRAFLLLLLMGIINLGTAAVFQGPFFAAAIMMSTRGQPSRWMLGLSSVFGGLGGALAAPLVIIGLVLLYFDIRVRKEAFDLQLLMGPPIENTSGDSPAAAAAPSI